MLMPPFSFVAIMQPLCAERFFAEYEGKKPLLLKGAANGVARGNWIQIDIEKD